MDDVMTIAATGMQTALASLNAHAANVVSAGSPVAAAAPNASPGSTSMPPSTLAYDPAAPFANLQGMTDPATDIVGTVQAANDFSANLAVFRTGEHMFKSLLDTVA